jgi:hypothetical protein
MFELLEKTQGLSIPVKPTNWGQQNLRRAAGSKAAEFPPELIKPASWQQALSRLVNTDKPIINPRGKGSAHSVF